jgi:hypothetical protein
MAERAISAVYAWPIIAEKAILHFKRTYLYHS